MPCTLQASSCLLGCSGVVWVGGLASPDPLLVASGPRCELRRVFFICWSVVVTCSRTLYGMLWSHRLFLLFSSLRSRLPLLPCCFGLLAFSLVGRSGLAFRAFLCRWLLLQRSVVQVSSCPHLRKFSRFWACVLLFSHVGQLPSGSCGCIPWVEPSLPLWLVSVEVGHAFLRAAGSLIRCIM